MPAATYQGQMASMQADNDMLIEKISVFHEESGPLIKWCLSHRFWSLQLWKSIIPWVVYRELVYLNFQSFYIEILKMSKRNNKTTPFIVSYDRIMTIFHFVKHNCWPSFLKSKYNFLTRNGPIIDVCSTFALIQILRPSHTFLLNLW